MKNTVEFKNPWFKTDQDLTKQLKVEIGKNHVLADKKIKTIARREDNDDVLYEIIDNETNYAIVHLTWKSSKHSNPNYPRTQIFKDLEEVQEQINEDNFQWD